LATRREVEAFAFASVLADTEQCRPEQTFGLVTETAPTSGQSPQDNVLSCRDYVPRSLPI